MKTEPGAPATGQNVGPALALGVRMFDRSAMPDSEIQVDESTETGGRTAVATLPVKKPAVPKRRPKQLPPFKVLLHNDEVNTF
jgi:hypothetical protein